MTARTVCPYCGRHITAKGGRYTRHGLTYDSDQYCPLSEQPAPTQGFTPDDHRRRAGIVCQLAAQLRDQDPTLIHSYLAVQPRPELERLLTVALAAIPTDKTLLDIFDWVTQLPEARHA